MLESLKVVSLELCLEQAFISSALVFAAAICFGMVMASLRSFVGAHNPFGADLINVLTFPGVIHHELSHALFAFLTGAKVEQVKVFRLHQKDGRLGYVSYRPRGNYLLQSIQKVCASIAPIIMGLITCSLLHYFLRPQVLDLPIWRILYDYLFASILLHMSLSSQDVKVMKGGIVLVFLLMTMIFAFLQVDLWENIVQMYPALEI